MIPPQADSGGLRHAQLQKRVLQQSREYHIKSRAEFHEKDPNIGLLPEVLNSMIHSSVGSVGKTIVKAANQTVAMVFGTAYPPGRVMSAIYY